MGRPPFGREPERHTCSSCGELVVVPPGVYYRGEPMHRHCAQKHELNDLTADVVAPALNQVEQDLSELLSGEAP